MTADRGFDTLIVDGQIVDGTGNPGYRAAVGIRDDTITVLRGDVSEIPSREVVDATGMVVSPGFIDAHSHSDLVLLDDPYLEAKVFQGVTTEIIGVDGLSYAPFDDPDDLEAFVSQNAGIAGQPSTPLGWRGVADQLARYDQRSAVNVATFVGNTALRINALGWDDAHADARALDAMAGRLREAMQEGALGLSTGLDYPPGSYATTEELVHLSREVSRHGGIYHTHVRYSLGDAYLDPFREALDIGRNAEVPVQITHFSRSSRSTHPGGAQRMLDLLTDAREVGDDVTFDTYTYEWGGTRLARLLPAWVQTGHPSGTRERILDPANRDRLRADIDGSVAVRAYHASRPFADVRIGNLTCEEHLPFEGRYLSEVVAEAGGGLAAVLCDLVAENPAATFTRPSPDPKTLWKFVCHPLGMIASDSVLIGQYPSPRAYGCFSRVLADYVREERLLSLPEAVRKMTSVPAQRLGLTDRGMVRDGAKADLVVFDLDTVGAPASYERPRLRSVGMRDIFVNGVAVMRNSAMTGATPGRGLRGPGAV
jgi:N-acyl-D-amino-acid deacylase